MPFTIEELATILSLKPRTIHFWKQAGLFEGPGAGPGARYDDEHLGTLFLIDRLRRGGMPLSEIKKELKRQSAADLRRLAEGAKATPPPPQPTAKALIASWLGTSGSSTSVPAGDAPHASDMDVADMMMLRAPSSSSHPRVARSGPPPVAAAAAWERVALADGLELHIRQPSTSATRKLVRELIAFAGRARKE